MRGQLIAFSFTVPLLWMVVSSLGFSAAWAQAPSEATVYIDRAVIAYEEKKFEAALSELQEALRLDPQNVEALYYQGIVYLTLNRPAEAQVALEKALSLRPANADISFQLGVLYFNQQNYEKAEPLLNRVRYLSRQDYFDWRLCGESSRYLSNALLHQPAHGWS